MNQNLVVVYVLVDAMVLDLVKTCDASVEVLKVILRPVRAPSPNDATMYFNRE